MLVPIAITVPNWKEYTGIVSKHLNVSPRRGLDDSGIGTDSVASYLASLGWNTPPVTTLSNRRDVWKHVSASFIGEVSESILVAIVNRTELYITSETVKRDYLILVSGHMGLWVDAVINCCTDNAEPELRACFTSIYGYFCSAGFRLLWSKYESRRHSDGTLVFQ